MKDQKFPGPSFFHGTRADLKIGDMIEIGRQSNYGKGHKANYVYLTGTLNAAIWGAELANGNSPEKIYVVEATGPIEDDPNLTNKKFNGNPTLSYRTQHPLRILAEVVGWQGHSANEVMTMKENIKLMEQQGIEAINE